MCRTELKTFKLVLEGRNKEEQRNKGRNKEVKEKRTQRREMWTSLCVVGGVLGLLRRGVIRLSLDEPAKKLLSQPQERGRSELGKCQNS